MNNDLYAVVCEIQNRYDMFIEFEDYEYNDKLESSFYELMNILDTEQLDCSKFETNWLEDADGDELGLKYWIAVSENKSIDIDILVNAYDLDNAQIRLAILDEDIDSDESFIFYVIKYPLTQKRKILNVVKKITSLANKQCYDELETFFINNGEKI